MSYKLIKGLASNSASPTDIWFMQDENTGEKCISKMFIRSLGGKDLESSHLLEYEAGVYKYISDHVRRPTFFFVEYKQFVTLTLENLIHTLALFGLPHNAILRNLHRNIKYMIKPPPKAGRKAITDVGGTVRAATASDYKAVAAWKDLNISFRATITGAVEGDSFDKFIAKKKEIDLPMISSLFFAIYCLAEIGVNQNDMHWDNVLTREIAASHYYIFFNRVFYVIESSHVPVLFDYDRATIKGHNNKLLTWHEDYGNCQQFHRQRDVVKAMCILYHTLPEHTSKISVAELQADIALFVDKKILDQSSDCWLQRKSNVSLFCETSFLDTVNGDLYIELLLQTNTNFAPAAKMIEHPLFIADVQGAFIAGGLERARLLLQHTQADDAYITEVIRNITRK